MLIDQPTKTGVLHQALAALFCITINDGIYLSETASPVGLWQARSVR